ncbi:MAG: hypothetical protein ACYTDX_02740, partial [Planctomycetota bacterium]
MKSLSIRGLIAPLALGLAVLAAPAAAYAQGINEIQPAGDTVTGRIESSGDVVRIPYTLVEGTSFSLQAKIDKGSTLFLDLNMLGVDREDDTAGNALFKVAKKGNKAVLKKHFIEETGLRYLEVRGANGSTGAFSVKFKVKVPTKLNADATASEGGEVVAFTFTVPGNAVGAFVAKKGKKSTAIPAFDDLVGPDEESIFVDAIEGKSGFKATNVPLNLPGDYTLTVTASEAGSVAVKGKWKVSKPVKRVVDASQIVVLPILTGISPEGGENSGAVEVDLQGSFLQQGAFVRFVKVPTVVTVPAVSITVDDDGAAFFVNLIPFTAGQYDVEVENPDGGRSVLEDAFEVVNAQALPTSLVPAFGPDNAVVRVSVQGSFLSSGATLELRKDAETIVGAGVSGGGGSMSVDFDLRGRPLGLWDLAVINPLADEGLLVDAFTITNAPPVLQSMVPDRNLGNPVVNSVITGTDIEDGATVRLERTDEDPLNGTNVNRVSDMEIRATFDTVEAPVGRWSVIVQNPDGQEGQLDDVFRTSGPVGDPVQSLTATGTADGPVAVAYNPDREEYGVAWVDINTAGTSYTIYARRLDSEGAALGSSVSISGSAST